MRILRIYNSNVPPSGKYFIFQYYLDVRICENVVYYDVNIDAIRPQKAKESASERLTVTDRKVWETGSIQIVYKNVLVQN